MSELWLAAGGVVVCLIFSFLFSGSETAMTASSKARLLALETNGDTRATLVQKLSEKKDRLIGALLVGNNLVNTLAASLTTSILIALFGDAGVVYATVMVTVMLGDFRPGALCANRVALRAVHHPDFRADIVCRQRHRARPAWPVRHPA
jgi:Mg2+/Co2+ transporter CorB